MTSTSESTRNTFDRSRAEAFEERFVDALNGGALALMSSVGHQLGLFQALADGLPASSQDLAARLGLSERYVREWLGAMTVARVVDADAETGTYTLPPEHSNFLTDAGEANLAVFAQYLPLLGLVEQDIVDCFRQGGGVPYERFARFHDIMAEDSGQTVLPALLDHILPLAPGLIDRLEAGLHALDVGCGRGRAVLLMAERFPRSQFIGYDLSSQAVTWAQEEADRRGLSNVAFGVRDLSTFDRDADPGAFDLVTSFDAIHDQAHPLAVLQGVHRSLVGDGVYLAQDIHGSSDHAHDIQHPLGTLLYTLSCMHCMTVSLAQGGEGLGAMWGRRRAHDYFRAAGFQDIQVHQLQHDVQNDYFVCRP